MTMCMRMYIHMYMYECCMRMYIHMYMYECVYAYVYTLCTCMSMCILRDSELQ